MVVADCLNAIDLAPEALLSYTNLCVTRMELGDLQGALKQFWSG